MLFSQSGTFLSHRKETPSTAVRRDLPLVSVRRKPRRNRQEAEGCGAFFFFEVVKKFLTHSKTAPDPRRWGAVRVMCGSHARAPRCSPSVVIVRGNDSKRSKELRTPPPSSALSPLIGLSKIKIERARNSPFFSPEVKSENIDTEACSHWPSNLSLPHQRLRGKDPATKTISSALRTRSHTSSEARSQRNDEGREIWV